MLPVAGILNTALKIPNLEAWKESHVLKAEPWVMRSLRSLREPFLPRLWTPLGINAYR